MMEFATVLGLSPTGLYVLRELGAAGVPALGVSDATQAGCYSRHLTVGPKLIKQGATQELAERLLAAAASEGARGVLMPTSDSFIEFVVEHGERLKDAFAFQQSYNPDSYRQIVDKQDFYQACEANGIKYPAAAVVDRSDLANPPEHLRFPCLVKPALIHRVKEYMAGRKVLIAGDLEAYRRVVDSLPEADTRWLLQEVVPGPESEITLYAGYFDKTGSPRQSFTARKVRQYPPGFGSASLVRSEELGDIKELSEHLLSRIGFQGIAGVEFKWDERDQCHKVIEVNPRPTLWFSAANGAGKRIAEAAFCDLTGRELPAEKPQRNDVLWRYFLKDFTSQLYYLRNRNGVLAPPETAAHLRGVRRRVWPVYTGRDPAPLFGELRNYAAKAFARLLSR